MRCLSPQIVTTYRKVKDPKLSGSAYVSSSDDYMYVPCGKCDACRMSLRRRWSSRCFFESLCHTHTCMVTLTYDDSNLPTDGLLSLRDLQLYLKRLRKRLSPTPVRYFACGEYGSKTLRPHYHLLLFGISGVLPEWEHAITASWDKGFVHIGDCSYQAIRYVTGYMFKKLEKKYSPQVKEFQVMSRRPGIGCDFVKIFKAVLKNARYRKYILSGELPYVMHDGHKVYFDRYMRDKLYTLSRIVLSDDVKEVLKDKMRCRNVNYDDIVQAGLSSIGSSKYKLRGKI